MMTLIALIAFAAGTVATYWTLDDIRDAFRARGAAMLPVTKGDIVLVIACLCTVVTALHSLTCLWIRP